MGSSSSAALAGAAQRDPAGKICVFPPILPPASLMQDDESEVPCIRSCKIM